MFDYYLSNKTTRIITWAILIISLALIFNSPTLAQETAKEKTIFGKASGGAINAGKEIYGLKTAPSEDPLAFAASLITIVNTLLTFIGVIFLCLMVYAGYIWMMARGAEEELNRAKTMIRQLITGIIIILIARIATEFILTQLGGATTPTP